MERAVIEVFGGCNYKCKMCPQTTGRQSSFLRKMPLDMFESILDQLPGKPIINLEGSGEPTMVEDLDKYISACSSRGLKSFIYCNGSGFTADLMKRCLDAGLTYIRFSMIGYTPVLYKEWMSEDNWGLIVRNIQDIILKDMLNERGFDTIQNDHVYNGGPVNPRAVCMMHTTGWHSSNTMVINDQISITSDDLMIYKFVNGDIPDAYKFVLGSAVWHPRQIVMELQANHWLVTELSTHKIFDYEGRELWDMAIEANAKETIERFF